ncbi:MAG: hypothetical protein ACRC62_23020 [Microcoleus sp.]
MLEKLLLAAALTLSVQIFAGTDRSAKLPTTSVFRLFPNSVTAVQHSPRRTLACSSNQPQRILLAESAAYPR